MKKENGESPERGARRRTVAVQRPPTVPRRGDLCRDATGFCAWMLTTLGRRRHDRAFARGMEGR